MYSSSKKMVYLALFPLSHMLALQSQATLKKSVCLLIRSLLQNSSNAANFPCVRGGGAAGAQAGAGLSWVTRSIWSTASATTPNMRWHLTLIAPQIALDVVPARFHSVERIVGHCCCYGSGGL